MAAPPTPVAVEQKEVVNVWQESLEKQIGLQRLSDASIILLGDKGCGKENLAETFVKSEEGSDEKLKTLLINYRNLTFRDQDNDEEIANCHIWEVSDTKHLDMLATVLRNTAVQDITYIIVLDSSKPETTKNSYQKWIKFIEEIQTKLMENLNEEETHKLKEKVSRHIQFYSDPGDSTANILSDQEKTEIDTDFAYPTNNLGVPIAVVVAKCDKFGRELNEAERVENFDVLLLFAQQWGLDYGASCFTFLDNQAVQARRILSYAIHRTQNVPFKESPSIVVSWTNLDEDYLLNPSGFVNPSISTEQEEFYQIFPASTEEKEKQKKKSKLQAEKDDQVFLKRLHLDIGDTSPMPSASRREKPSSKRHDHDGVTSKQIGKPRISSSRPAGPMKSRPPKPNNGRNQEVVQKFFRQLLKDGSSGTTSNQRTSGRETRSSRSSRREGGSREYQKAKNQLDSLAAARSGKDGRTRRDREKRERRGGP